MSGSSRIFVIASCVAAIVVQLVAAPYIVVFGVVPNFIVALVVALALAHPSAFGPLLPFVMGLVFDLATGGPVGAMAFSLTLFSYLIARYFEHLGNDSVFMAVAFVALAVLLVELSYGVFLMLFGYQAGFVEVLAYRVAPCFVYDTVLAMLLFFVARRFVSPRGVMRADITQLR